MNLQIPGNRRAILWNVQQPGDAYDIRKSMIAKLPQHPARFMGDNLQLVCLFQAAQIQRLAQFLDEMTLQMRSIQRIELDRHMYQVQIKQLAQKVNVSHEYKNENLKLREFIKSQSEQMQSLQRYRNSSQNLVEVQNKYESVLNELRISRQNYAGLQRTNNEALKEIAEWRFRHQRAEKALIEERQARQRELRIAVEKAIYETKSGYESREYQLKGQINVMKQNLVLKNRQLQLQRSKNSQLSKLLSQKQQLIGKYTRGQIQLQSNKTQQLLRISRRLQESTYYLQQKEKNIINLKDQVTYVNKKVKQLEDELKKKQEEIRRVTQQLRDKSSIYNNDPDLIVKISQSQQRTIILSSQIERLKQTLLAQERQMSDKDRQLNFYKDKSISYQRTLQYHQKEIKQKQSIIKTLQFDSKIFEDKDIKIEQLGGEVERLNIVMRQKLNQMARMENRINQLNQANQYNFTLLKAKQEAIRVLEDRSRDYDMKASSFQESNKLNFDQINRLNLKVASIENQNIQLRRQIDMKTQSSLQSAQLIKQITNLTEEINRKNVENLKLREDNELMFKEIQEWEHKLSISGQTINQLRSTMSQKIQQKDQQLRNLQVNFSMKEQAYVQKIDMYSKSMPKMSAQIDRLQQLLEKRQAENKRLQQDLDIQLQKTRIAERRNSSETEMRFLEYERNMSFLERKCQNYEQVNSDMAEDKNRIVEKMQSLEIKLRDTQLQLDRIIAALKVKQSTLEEHLKNSFMLQNAINQLREENLRLQSEYLTSRQEIQLNFEMTKKIQFDFDLCRRDLSKSRADYSGLIEEYNRVKALLEQGQSKNPVLQQTIESLRHELSKAENQRQYLLRELNERKRRGQVYEQEIRTFQQKIAEYQQNIKHIEQVNSIKIEEIRQRMAQDFQNRLRGEAAKYSQLQEMYSKLEYEYQSSSHHFQDQGDRLDSLQSQNSELRRHLTQYQQKLFSYEQKIALLSQQIQRLSFDNEDLRNKLQQNKKDQVDTQMIRRLNLELQQTKVELMNLKNMLQQYESVNQHALAERDELFAITHEQQELINRLKVQINTLNGNINSLNANLQQAQNAYSQLQMMREQYNIIFNQLSTIKQQYTEVINELQMANQKVVQINPNELIQRDNQIKQLQFSIHRVTEQYENTLRTERQRNSELQQNLHKQSRVIANLENQYNQLRAKLTELEHRRSQQSQIQVQLQQLKTAYINIKLQNQQITRMLQEMHQQLFEANQQKSNLHQQTTRLANQNSRLQSSLEEQRRTLITVSDKLSYVSTQIQQTRLSADNRINMLDSELNKAQQENIMLRQQLQNLQIQISQVSVYQEISAEWESKYNALYQAYEETYKIYNEMKLEYESVQQNLRLTQLKQLSFQKRISRLNQEFQKVTSIITQLRNQILNLKQENDNLRRDAMVGQNDFSQMALNNEELQKQLKRVYLLNNDLSQQAAQIRLRLTDQHALEERIRQNMILFVMLFAEIESLRNRVQQTEKECEQVRRSSITPIKPKK